MDYFFCDATLAVVASRFELVFPRCSSSKDGEELWVIHMLPFASSEHDHRR